jgi:cytochrome c-type protein NapC
MDPLRLLTGVSLGCAAVSAVLLIRYLLRRPPLTTAVKLSLLFGVGVLPVAAALTGNVVGYEVTKRRDFCASCHTMAPYIRDAADPESTSIASFHSRNESFGDESCYVCHRDYALFGAVTTKVKGMRHLWAYYAEHRGESAPKDLHLYAPFPNTNCTWCHSTTLPGWTDEPEHEAMAAEIRSGETSCATEGCHGPAHALEGKAAP